MNISDISCIDKSSQLFHLFIHWLVLVLVLDGGKL